MFRKISVFSVIFIFILLIQTMPVSSADSQDRLMFDEINPFGSYEGFSIFNHGDFDIDLKGYEVSDGEGTISFADTLTISANTRLTVVREIGVDDMFSSRDNVYAIGSNGIEMDGNFIIANAGDDLYLRHGAELKDAVCYGNKNASEGWIGDPAVLKTNHFLKRIGSQDSDTSADWIYTKFGFTAFPFDSDGGYISAVTPFVFPDSEGEPVYRALENARESVRISMYLLTSPNVVALLCELESGVGDDHVDVYVTLEGDVLNQDMSRELSLMRSLTDAGGEVRLINDRLPGNSERYSYLHTKYAVIDNETTIVTSENWTASNMGSEGSNRGWGVAIDNIDLAEHMISVFENDRDTSYGDVWNLTDYYEDLKPYSGDLIYVPPESRENTSFEATVLSVLSPDNSYGALRYLIENSERRVYAEQLDLGSSYSNLGDSSPVSWMADAAGRGVDSRLILDTSLSEDNISSVNLINATTGVKAVGSDHGTGYETIHNKGLIIDDSVWIGSVNWTENSFMNNREAAVLVKSAEVSEYFLEYFMSDWGINEHTLEDDGLKISVDIDKIHSNSTVVFRVSGPVGQTYLWDIYGDGTVRTSNIPMIVCKGLEPGVYTMSVRLEGTEYSAEYDYVVLSAEEEDGPDLLLMLSLGILVAGGATAFVRGRYNKSVR